MTTPAPPADHLRVRRAQMAAAADRSHPKAVAATRWLMDRKLRGQTQVAWQALRAWPTADRIGTLRTRLRAAQTVAELCHIESQAARAYFAAWRDAATPTWTSPARVPDHWRAWPGRRRTPTRRHATHPVHALLDWCYTLAVAECTIAAAAHGLDPAFGIVHPARTDRPGLSVDLVEPVRPTVERWVLALLAGRRFTPTDFTELGDGTVQLSARLRRATITALDLWRGPAGEAAAGLARILGGAR